MLLLLLLLFFDSSEKYLVFNSLILRVSIDKFKLLLVLFISSFEFVSLLVYSILCNGVHKPIGI